MRLSLPFAIAVTVAALAGCASPKATFYTLSSQPPAQSTAPAMPVTVLIGSVTVPDLVDRPQIVVRTSANQVTIDEFARWADSLKSQIPRVIAADLAQELNSPRVSAYPMAGDPAALYRVQIDVQRFDATLGDAVTVDVLWSVSPPGKRAPLHGRSTVREPCGDAGLEAMVAAYSRAFATVSGDISASIRAAASS
ncbi:PqiC family protein [Paraburkholderia terricola]|uniref:PqiC family protein n=1 Tax=Paraburkholderia terricola TaxID=169427 RepID=UPI0024142FB0|nr:PqiC family protein [Paraburkholderia terricola]